MKRVLVGSPVRQKSNILKEFLLSLEEVDKTGLEFDYYFVDDNTDEESSKLLKNFEKKHKGNVILKIGSEIYDVDKNSHYDCNNDTHLWKRDLIEKITSFKDGIIDYARDNGYDYLFFIDSDIVLSKPTILHLISRKVDIVSNIFWTQFFPNRGHEPQVWLQDECSRNIKDWDREKTRIESEQERIDFLTKLRLPGIYEVGGLGACTLISKNALKQGVKFKLIDNLSFWGEDRHFCIRAGALGIKMYVDTVYPAYHIYREKYLDRVDEFKKEGFKFDMCMGGGSMKHYSRLHKIKTFVKNLPRRIKQKIFFIRRAKFNKKRVVGNNKIVLSMIVHNEAGRYLEKVLEQALKVVDAALIIDDASTDNTAEICESMLKNIPHKIIKNEKSLFHKEHKLRTMQWKETLKFNPGWILSLDADEVLEDNAKAKIQDLINIDNIDVYNFKLFDMWNETEYRDDKWWNIHKDYRPILLRYQPKYHYKFKKTNQHCGRVPRNLKRLYNANVEVYIKHFGWAREEDRKSKYKRYQKLDKDSKNGIVEQYESILDKNPNLKKFEDYGKN